MTGFGRGEAQDARRAYTVQVKSVNSRFLELGLKLPPEFWGHEAEARALLQGSLKRGKVDLHWNEGPRAGLPAGGVRVDVGVAAAWRQALEPLAADLDQPAGLSLEALVRLPGVVAAGEGGEQADPSEVEERWRGLRRALEAALAGLEESRAREGRALAAELESLLRDAEARLEAVEKRSLEFQDGFAERLRRRLARILETLAPDDPRIAMEAALAADKADVREEVVRFRVHTQEFRRLLNAGEAEGKRMDFLCQELLREANTMGSKSPDAGLTGEVVGLKSVVERLKEQALNVE